MEFAVQCISLIVFPFFSSLHAASDSPYSAALIKKNINMIVVVIYIFAFVFVFVVVGDRGGAETSFVNGNFELWVHRIQSWVCTTSHRTFNKLP